MKRWIVTVMVLGTVTGCQTTSVKEAREDAYHRWYRTRAQILCGIAGEHLKVGQLDRAEHKAREALALDEKNIEARILLGKALIEQGRYAAACVEIEKIRAKLPESSRVTYLLGVAQEKDGKLPEALVSYRRAHALNADNLDAAGGAVEVLITMGRIRQAQLYVESFIESAGDNPAIHELASRAALMNKEYDKAVRYCQQACDLDYKNLKYRESLGRAQYRAGQFREAVGTLKALTELPDYALPEWVHTMLGDCYMAIGRPVDARDAYFISQRRNPSDPLVWSNLAKAALAMGDDTRAIISAGEALHLNPDRLDATLLLGYAMVRSGQARRAISVLAQAVARHPGNSMLQCLLGRAHGQSGNRVKAMRCYAEALRLTPENELAKELMSGDAPKSLSKAD